MVQEDTMGTLLCLGIEPGHSMKVRTAFPMLCASTLLLEIQSLWAFRHRAPGVVPK